MQLPLEITFRDIENTPALENKIRQKAEKLTQFYDRIIHARVVVEAVQKHKHQGKLFRINIVVDIPRKTLIVNKQINEDLYVAIRDAFAAMKRQLEDYANRQRGDVKNHHHPLKGEIVRLFPDYGFIQTADGNEYYFHESHVLQPNFKELYIGIKVSFFENIGGDGLQADKVSGANE